MGAPGSYGSPNNMSAPGSFGSPNNMGAPGSFGSPNNMGAPGSFGSPNNINAQKMTNDSIFSTIQPQTPVVSVTFGDEMKKNDKN